MLAICYTIAIFNNKFLFYIAAAVQNKTKHQLT